MIILIIYLSCNPHGGQFLVIEVNKKKLKLPGTTTTLMRMHIITHGCTHAHGLDLENHTLKSLMESMSSGKQGSWKKKK